MILALFAMMLQSADAAGFYQSTTPEVGAAIELEPNGTFLYALDYGDVSETAEGNWQLDGNVIRLTSTKSQGTARGGDLAVRPLRLEGSFLLLDRYGVTVRFQRERELALPGVQNRHLEKRN
jgi:hypothetical protein